MKKTFCIVLMMLMLSSLLACGSNINDGVGDMSPSQTVATQVSTLASDIVTETETDSFDVLKKALDAYNEYNYDEYHEFIYGDFDFSKAINLFYNCLSDMYGEESFDRINREMNEEYNTSDFKTAFEMWCVPSEGLAETTVYTDDKTISSKVIVSSEEAREIIEKYNDCLPTSCYDDFETYDELGNAYGEYMYKAINSMYINPSDVEELVQYTCPVKYSAKYDSLDMYCAKINGKWYPLVEPVITEFEYFAK